MCGAPRRIRSSVGVHEVGWGALEGLDGAATIAQASALVPMLEGVQLDSCFGVCFHSCKCQ
eukprot:49439-Alexandrium_andersonii.AAC.1